MATVQPIKSRDDLQKVRSVLKSNRDRALFTFGINTAFRGGDILAFNVGDVAKLVAGDAITRSEQKTDKKRMVNLNEACIEALKPLLAERYGDGATDADPLFVSERGLGAGSRLTIRSLSRMWKAWCEAAGLEGNFGSHTGRKSFGYLQRTERKVPIEILQKALNHSSPATTLIYLGIQDDELKDLYTANF